jgi:hypothetical protein
LIEYSVKISQTDAGGGAAKHGEVEKRRKREPSARGMKQISSSPTDVAGLGETDHSRRKGRS